jgi:VWFA-related protein
MTMADFSGYTRVQPRGARRFVALSVAVAGLAAQTLVAQQPPLPQFQTSVEVTSLDVTVVDDRGVPVTDLLATDFLVRIDDQLRKVVSAEWVPLKGGATAATAIPIPQGYSSNENATGGRLVLIVVDEPNIDFGAAAGVRSAINRFVDTLPQADRIAAVSLGTSSASTPFTSDRERIKMAVARMGGQKRSLSTAAYNINVSLSEVVEMNGSNPMVRERVIERECAGLSSIQLEVCMTEVDMYAASLMMESRADSNQTIGSLRALFQGLQMIKEPKTVVLVTDGFMLGDEMASLIELGALAMSSRITLYALKIDETFLDVTNSRAPITPMADRQVKMESLELLAGAARGSLYNVGVGADTIFRRIESEMSGYYLLGVEPGNADKDGRPHSLRVSVSRRGLTVRSRRDLIFRPEDERPKSPREAMFSAMTTPVLMTALPLRVTTFSLRGPEAPKVQVLIHADVGANYSSSRVVSVGWLISDAQGRTVESQVADARLPPVMNGVPSPLQFDAGASLDPGEYTLKLSIAEGDRVGTVEHTVRAGMNDAGPVELSDLIAGGPTDAQETLRPTVGYSINFGSLHGYVEAYGRNASDVSMTYEIAARPDGEAILTADVEPRLAGGERAIFSRIIPVRQLPPGSYVLRAMASTGASGSGNGGNGGAGGKPVKTMLRPFEIAPPPVLMTSAEGLASGSLMPTDLYLPVGEGMLARGFRRDEMSEGNTLKTFRERVPSSARTSFDAGVASLSKGDYTHAENSFKSAIDIDADATAALVYLAATFAASGHDQEAAGAWQTALIEGSDEPQIYSWLSDALIRTNDLGEARTILLEAVEKWPADPRFAKPLALLYGMFGQGREAVRTLARHIEAQPNDLDALALGVEWTYHLHLSGTTATTRAEDLKRARAYADSYAKAKGPQAALVKQWMEYLQGK